MRKRTVRINPADRLESITEELPFIDEHSIEVDADPETVWQALTESFGDAGGGLFAAYARVIGADPVTSSGDLNQVGSTRVGFRVAESESPVRLELTGKHRFSNYSLTWTIDEAPNGNSRLAATTRARFPGIHGRAYKAVVIDSSAHARITRRMLEAVGRRATRP